MGPAPRYRSDVVRKTDRRAGLISPRRKRYILGVIEELQRELGYPVEF